jgi:hypothetical protein
VKHASESEAQWFKSSYSSGNGQCVEVARSSQVTAVRDSVHPDGVALTFPTGEWVAFLSDKSSI